LTKGSTKQSLPESLNYQGNDRIKLNHDSRKLQIKKNSLAQEEAERIKYENEKKAKNNKEELSKKSKFNSILNALSTK